MHKTLRGVFSEPSKCNYRQLKCSFIIYLLIIDFSVCCFFLIVCLFIEPPPRRNFLRENVMKIKRMQQCCENIKPNASGLSSKASSMNNLAPKRPSFVTTVNPKQTEKVLPPQSLKQNKSKVLGPKKQIVTKNVTKPISNSNSYNNKNCLHKSESLSRPSSSMSNITVRDQCIQTEDNTKEETFLKDTIIRYPSSTTLSSNRQFPLNYNKNEEIPLVGSLKKEGSAHSLGKSVSIVTPSDLDSRDGDLDDEERYKNKKRYPKETIGDFLRSSNKSPVLERNDRRTLKGTNVDSLDIPTSKLIELRNILLVSLQSQVLFLNDMNIVTRG